MKLEQKLGLLVTHIVSSQVPLHSAIQPLYHGVLVDFKNDPYISIYVKGKSWQFTDRIDPLSGFTYIQCVNTRLY